MKGLLFYDHEGARRNEWFIDRLIASAERRGCELRLIVHKKGDEFTACSGYDFAIVRTIDPDLNEALESSSIPTFNNSMTSRVANDKYKTYLLARELGIPVMDTVLISSDTDLTALDYPMVIKSVDGHGGSEVFKVENAEECKLKLSLLQDKRVIAQSLCDEAGVDTRVYVMGDKVLGAAKRTSQTDFRSNFSLGGSAEMVTATDEMTDAIRKLGESLSFDFVGVDFIRHKGRWVLNEIEDVVGTRMLYSLTDIDAADRYIGYIIDRITK